MKSVLKNTLAVALVLGSGLGAAEVMADVALPSSGDGELVLFVRDVNNPTRAYARGLGITMNDLLTEATAAGAYSGQGQTFNFSLPTFSSDNALDTFLGTAGTYVWTIMGGDTAGSTAAGTVRFATTINQDVPFASVPTNSALISGWGGLESMMGELNGNLSGANSTQPNGVWGQNGNNAENWFGFGPNNENALGSAANLYVFTTAGGTNFTAGRIFQALDVRLDGDGTLHVVGQVVPLPAAVWLLCSGLIGLAGVGRRRSGAAVAAA